MHVDPVELFQGRTSLPDGMPRYEALSTAGIGLDVALFFSNSIYNSARPVYGWRRVTDILEGITRACAETPEVDLLRHLNSTSQKLFAIHTRREYQEGLVSADA